MSDLYELTITLSTTDTEHALVRAVVALFESYVPGGAAVEVSGFGPYGEPERAQHVPLRTAWNVATSLAANANPQGADNSDRQ